MKPFVTSFFGNFLIGLSMASAACADTVTVTTEDLRPAGRAAFIVPGLEVSAPDDSLPFLGDKMKGPGADLLRRLHAQGRAGGFSGVLYENRDRGHSSLDAQKFPRIARIDYGPELRKRNADFGLAGRIIFPAIVLGNSSTALTNQRIARSQTRLAMTTPDGPSRAFLTYANNHVYLYPEHRDHDAADLFPANWPYMVTTQGSSYSDQPFMDALAMTLAAFSAETKEALREARLVAPTLQMILRRTQKGIYRREQYLSPVAHPTVFDKSMLAPERMIDLASSITPQDIPPMVRLKIESEGFTTSAGLAGLSEHLFTTPSAVARIWRSPDYEREMVVSAVETRDPIGRELSFAWVVLRGDPEKVQVTPLDPQGSRARIRIAWQEGGRIAPPAPRTSDRVDIGVFAWNGVHDSAPAFVSVSFPTHQRREYRPTGSDGKMRLASVDYGLERQEVYLDPLLHWWAPWRDSFRYSAEGEVVDWARQTPERTVKLVDQNAPGRMPKVSYDLDPTGKKPVLKMVIDSDQ